MAAYLDWSVFSLLVPLQALEEEVVNDPLDWRISLELVNVATQLYEQIEDSYVEITIFARVAVAGVRAKGTDPVLRLELFQRKVIAVLDAIQTELLIAAEKQAVFDVEEGLVNVLGMLVFAGYKLLRALIEEFGWPYKLAVVADVL